MSSSHGAEQALDLGKLANVRVRGNKTIARCPACGEAGGDRKGEHLFIQSDGRFSCVQNQGPDGKEHRKRIFALAGMSYREEGARGERQNTPVKRCHAAATIDEAIAGVGRKIGMSETRRDWYHGSDGNKLFAVVRFDNEHGKDYRPFHRNSSGWVIKDPQGKLPLFGLPGLLDRATELVCIVEGEKCARELATLKVVSTTSAHGAKAAYKTDWTPLAGRDVVVLPDNDQEGRDYAQTVARILGELSPPAMVRIVQLPDLPHKGDVVDWLERRDAQGPEDIFAEFQGLVAASRGESPSVAATPWSDALPKAIVSSTELGALALRPRRKLLDDFFCEGDLGFIYAFRGVGKTWLALGIARALSEGSAIGPWQAHAVAKVLYVDGEMPPDLMRDRDQGLRGGAGEVEFLNHEILFDRTQKVLNVTDPEVQQAITDYCLEHGINIVVLDNLSTLASGMKENDSFAWEQVNNWLLQFRRHKIAVIMVHHAGRNGEARGTSKREDAAFWVMALDDAKKHTDDKHGARFISRFTKPSRNTQEEVPAYEWHITTEAVTGKISITYKLAHSLDVFRKLIDDGVTECTHLAEELKVSKGTIAKWAKKAFDQGWLRKKGREYEIIEGAGDGNEDL